MISVALMCHPKRADFVPSIEERLDADATVVWDQNNDRWDTGRRSMLAYDPAASHHLVVQDDAIVCRDLVAGLSRAVEAVPDNPIALYMGTVRPQTRRTELMISRARAEGRSWMSFEGPWWGVGVCIPTRHIDAMVAWGDEHPEVENYDRRMARYFNSIGLDCYYTLPSLVDHRQDHQSLVPGRVTLGRNAMWFIGAEASALDVDWTAGALYPLRDGFTDGICNLCGFQAPSQAAARRHRASARLCAQRLEEAVR